MGEPEGVASGGHVRVNSQLDRAKVSVFLRLECFNKDKNSTLLNRLF